MRAIGLILIASIVLLAHASASSNRPEAERRMPAGLFVDGPIAWGADWWKECSSSVYRLSDESAEAVRQDGLAGLEAVQAPTDGSEWPYALWKATPVDSDSQASWSVDGYVWAGLACGLNADWTSKSQSLGTKPGAYYRFGRGVLLLVDPAEGVVIYTQRDSLH